MIAHCLHMRSASLKWIHSQTGHQHREQRCPVIVSVQEFKTVWIFILVEGSSVHSGSARSGGNPALAPIEFGYRFWPTSSEKLACHTENYEILIFPLSRKSRSTT